MKDMSMIWCGDGKAAAALCKREVPEAVRQYVRRADEVCDNVFLFQDHWEMERTSEAVRFDGAVDWQYRPGGDTEWTYALNRHSFLPTLARAYVLTGTERYVSQYARLVSDWIERTALGAETVKTAWRPIEAGLRCENWLESMQLLRPFQVLPEELLRRMELSLRVHGEYLAAEHGDFQRLSNWGVIQDRGLFLTGIYLGEQRYVELSLKRLRDNLRLQILPDGIHWEQSPQYHAEVLQCLLTVVQAAARCEIPLPGGFREEVHGMAQALARWMKPNGCLLCQSDSDELETRDLLVQAAWLFQDTELKSYAEGAVFEDNYWSMGAGAITEYRKMESHSIKARSTAFPYSGNYILRDEEHYLHLHCGALGSGHGHGDLLHIDLFAHGEDILIDSGRYNYQDLPIRRELKSPAAHNTVTVDGKDFTVYKNSWDYSRIAQPVKGEYLFKEDCGYISGGHLGYWQEGVLAFRKVVQAAPGLYVIFDEFYSEGSHQYTQYFHFNNQGAVSTTGNRAEYQGRKAQAVLTVLSPEAVLTLADAPLSRTYNELEYGKCLQVTTVKKGFAGLITILAVNRVGSASFAQAWPVPVTLTKNGETLADNQAQAVRIQCVEGEYTVICLHGEVISEVGFVEANGCRGYGKVLVFSPDSADGTVLAW